MARRGNKRQRGDDTTKPGRPAAVNLHRHFAPVEILSDDQVEMIFEESLTLLQEDGVEFMGANARDVLRRGGASVDDDTGIVRIPREMVANALATAPSTVSLVGRNPDRAVHLGGNSVVFGMVSGPPFVHDCINGRRRGTFADTVALLKLAQS